MSSIENDSSEPPLLFFKRAFFRVLSDEKASSTSFHCLGHDKTCQEIEKLNFEKIAGKVLGRGEESRSKKREKKCIEL